MDVIFRIFSRTDLRIGVPRAKFDAESDFEVRLDVAPQKPGQSSEKLFSDAKISPDKKNRRRKMKCRESSETRFAKV